MLEKIKELRARTHLGMQLCKKALEVSNHSVEDAIVWLQKQGQIKKPEKVLDHVEGQVLAMTFERIARIITVSCETDFAARSQVFKDFTENLVKNSSLTDFDLGFLSKQLGEQVNFVNQVDCSCHSNDWSLAYNHHNGKISSLVVVKDGKNLSMDKWKPVLDEMLMMIVANKPLAFSNTDWHNVSHKKLLDSQREIITAQSQDLAKKDNFQQILDRKIDAFVNDNSLMQQKTLFNPKLTLAQLIDQKSKELNEKLQFMFIAYSEIGTVPNILLLS